MGTDSFDLQKINKEKDWDSLFVSLFCLQTLRRNLKLAYFSFEIASNTSVKTREVMTIHWLPEDTQ